MSSPECRKRPFIMDLPWATVSLRTELMWPHPAALVCADHIPCPSWGALFCTWKSIYGPPTAECSSLLPDTGAAVQLISLCPFSWWLEWAGEWDFRGMLPLGLMQAQPDKLCQEGTSLFQVKVHQSPVVATPDMDNSAWDVREMKGQQECAAMEDPAAHTGNELQILHPLVRVVSGFSRNVASVHPLWHQPQLGCY